MSVENAPEDKKLEATPMNEVMLAMDVVDTLRHSSRLIEKELASTDQDQQLLERLRSIYKTQGIDVPDYILQEGVQALREDRFSYTPTPRNFSRRLAEWYVARGKFPWKKVLIVAGCIYLLSLILLNTALVPQEVQDKKLYTEVAQTLPQDMRALHDRVYALTGDPQVLEQSDRLVKAALAALMVQDTQGALSDKAKLENITKKLTQEYDLRVISSPDESSGVWRVPDDNPNARNYYLIVEPVDEKGRVISLDISNEENNKVVESKKFGIRVPQDVFEVIKNDKQDDGIIQNNIIGTKKRGDLEPVYNVRTLDGMITEW